MKLIFKEQLYPILNFQTQNSLETYFSNSDLTNVDLSFSDLLGANFTNAKLTNVDFTGSNLSGVIFTGAYIENVDYFLILLFMEQNLLVLIWKNLSLIISQINSALFLGSKINDQFI